MSGDFTHEDKPLAFAPEPVEDRNALDFAVAARAREELALRLLRQAHEAIGHALTLLGGSDAPSAGAAFLGLVTARREAEHAYGGTVVTGVFDGTAVIGEDANRYEVPENYASKSLLVEGDVMKVVCRSDGGLVFKQIGPVERRRISGRMALDAVTGEPVVVCGHTAYKVLQASVSFFKACPGDEAIILIPKRDRAVWAAIERVNKK